MYVVVSGAVLVALCLVLAWRTIYQQGLAAIPGPLLARVSNLWKIYAVYSGDMPRKNVELHDKYGPVVRIGPSHVSFASPDALKQIYTARPSFPKSDFYKPTSPLHNGKPLFNLFSIQDVDYHARLKRNIGSLYTKSAVLELEPCIDRSVNLFIQRMRDLAKDGPKTLNMSLWLHFFAFDCLGDINLSKRFGFLETGTDIRGMIETADRILHMTGLLGQSPLLQSIQLRIKARWAKTRPNPLLLYSIAQTNERIKRPTKDPDMLNNFLTLREHSPDKVSLDEIAGAMYINLMAGHDVLAITLRAIFYYICRFPDVLVSLRKEFSELKRQYAEEMAIPYAEISKLSYLDAVIHETLRIHANTGVTLERVVPYGGATIDGYFVPAGTIVGVNAWVIHRNKEIFGEDVDVFRPERWTHASEEKVTEMKRFIFSFGDGSRKCIGQNIAMAQASKLLVEFFRRFDARLATPEKEWTVHGSWVTKQTDMDMIISKIGEV